MPEVTLGAVMRVVTAANLRQKPGDVAPALVRARLADLYRDVQLLPSTSAPFKPLDAAGWARLALLVSAMEGGREELAASVGDLSVERHVATGFIAPVLQKTLLTREILLRSEARIEELVRAWLAAMRLPVAGETPAASAKRLATLDYAALLARVEKAKLSAEERVKYLEELQEAQVVRRGKW